MAGTHVLICTESFWAWGVCHQYVIRFQQTLPSFHYGFLSGACAIVVFAGAGKAASMTWTDSLINSHVSLQGSWSTTPSSREYLKEAVCVGRGSCTAITLRTEKRGALCVTLRRTGGTVQYSTAECMSVLRCPCTLDSWSMV